MNRIVIFLVGFLVLMMSSASLKAQVGINTETPNPLTVLDVMKTNSPKGIMIPRMTESERGMIDVSNDSIANSLIIYNTDEDCYNYYSKAQQSWISLCGGVPKAEFTVDDCSAIVVNGSYTQGLSLNSSDYMTVTVNVTKAGSYTFSGNTSNGYGFTTQGTVVSIGTQKILVPGQGKPTNANQSPGDLVTFNSTGGNVNCNTLTIPVMPPTAAFSINCGTAKFNGAYVKGKALTAANTVTLNVNVSDISTGATWAVLTNTVNGISFSGSGTFSAVGNTTITLQGTGTPTGTDPITLTFTTNSKDGAATCNATVNIAIPPMKVLGLGDANLTYNYSVFNTQNANATLATKADNAKMVYDPKNFGTQANSTVQFGDGTNTWTVDPNSGATAWATIKTDLTSATPPDIVVIGYPWTTGSNANDQEAAGTFAKYLRKGGVLLCFSETEPSTTAGLFFNELLLDSILNTSGIITAANGNYQGGRYQFPTMSNDPVINGPFGNLSGQYWGEDASTTLTIKGLAPAAASQITVYTVATARLDAAGNPQATPYGQGLPTMIRHNTLSFIWCGDGGFNSCYDHTSTIYCPFLVQQTPPYIPIPKTTFSGDVTATGCVYGPGSVSNSIFTANALAWALNQAMINGINPH